MSDHVIEAEGLVKRYGKHTALDGVDLRARPGTVLSVLDPNGAWKTTSIRILATLTGLDAGTAEVAGMDVTREAARRHRSTNRALYLFRSWQGAHHDPRRRVSAQRDRRVDVAAMSS